MEVGNAVILMSVESAVESLAAESAESAEYRGMDDWGERRRHLGGSNHSNHSINGWLLPSKCHSV
jgi:hypothetical protein